MPTQPGRAWVVFTPLSRAGLNSDWELWSIAQAGSNGPSGTNERFYGPAILMHRLGTNGRNRVLVFGGSQDQNFFPGVQTTYTSWEANNSVQEFFAGTDPTAPGTPWKTKQPMLHRRVYLNAVILPNGKIFLVGGASVYNHPGRPAPFVATTPVSVPELYDPGQQPTDLGSTMPLAQSTIPPGMQYSTPRLYHGLAVMLPDGRVLVAGGHEFGQPGDPDVGYPESSFTGEIYSPDYIGMPRPSVLDGPPDQAFFDSTPGAANTFNVQFEVPNNEPILRVVLLRPAALTHHFDVDQRYIELEFSVSTQLDPPSLTVTRPAEDLGPPGYYMLFIVIDNGTTLVPSVAHWIRFY